MADPASGQKEEPGELPPAPAWDSGDPSYDGDDEPIALDKVLALPTLETVDDLLKELPCDASAPDLPVVQPEPSRMPVGRLALTLSAGALFGALALGGALLLLWDPETRQAEKPTTAEPAAAGVVVPQPLPTPLVPKASVAPNPVGAPAVPSAEAPTAREDRADTKRKRKPTSSATKRKRRGGKRSRGKKSVGNGSVSDEAAPETEPDSAPLVPTLPSLDELDADAAPPSSGSDASDPPQKPEQPSSPDAPEPSKPESPTAQPPAASPPQ